MAVRCGSVVWVVGRRQARVGLVLSVRRGRVAVRVAGVGVLEGVRVSRLRPVSSLLFVEAVLPAVRSPLLRRRAGEAGWR